MELEKIREYMRKQPTQRLSIVAVTDLETGETRAVESRQVGDTPPVSRRLSDKEILREE